MAIDRKPFGCLLLTQVLVAGLHVYMRQSKPLICKKAIVPLVRVLRLCLYVFEVAASWLPFTALVILLLF